MRLKVQGVSRCLCAAIVGKRHLSRSAGLFVRIDGQTSTNSLIGWYRFPCRHRIKIWNPIIEYWICKSPNRSRTRATSLLDCQTYDALCKMSKCHLDHIYMPARVLSERHALLRNVMTLDNCTVHGTQWCGEECCYLVLAQSLLKIFFWNANPSGGFMEITIQNRS